ncbi:uncharacterized protein LOC122071971 [Macadamia integrifolia]|uniref:uncharacterized protein LOC122071971 n=1 Tax=Macadamia integrifolia TaxID=60698 RepID=UPI001C501AB3|nr:uncharacterized protein LOC122071971 [Macadamia integrifolia]
MSSMCGGKATKRSSSKEEDGFKMVAKTKTKTKTSNDPKGTGERTVKARLGGAGGGGSARKAAKMEGDVRKRVVGDSISCSPEIGCLPENLLESEDWPRLSSLLDEQQMLWGLLWFPCLDKKYSSMNGLCGLEEILWEDDLWNLKSIKQIPNKPKDSIRYSEDQTETQ